MDRQDEDNFLTFYVICRGDGENRELLGRNNQNERAWMPLSDSDTAVESWTEYHMALNTVLCELPLYEETDTGCRFIGYKIFKLRATLAGEI